MKTRLSIAGVLAAIALSACASIDIPRGPALTYEDLLPNTHENPVWARNTPAAQPPRGQGGRSTPR